MKDDPDRSNRQVAAELGVDDKTVASARDALERTAEIPQLEKTKDKDGKARRKPSKPKITSLDFGAAVTVAGVPDEPTPQERIT